MPSIEINENLYDKLKKLANFLKQPLESLIEDFLEKDLEWVKENITDFMNKILTEDQIQDLVFDTQ